MLEVHVFQQGYLLHSYRLICLVKKEITFAKLGKKNQDKDVHVGPVCLQTS